MNRLKPLPPHGTTARYNSRDRCRCDLCKEIQRQRQAAYRERMYADGYVFRRGKMRRPSKKQTGRPTKQETSNG